MTTQDETTVSHAAGWYPDTANPGTQRYYDGTAWTQHTSPIIATATPPIAPMPTGTLAPEAKKKKRKWPFVIGGIVGLVILVSSCSAIANSGSAPEAVSDKTVEVVDEVEPAAEAAPVEEEPIAEPEPVAEPEPAAAPGEATNPLPQPYVAKGMILGGEKYSLTAAVVNAAANEQVNTWNPYNEPAPAGFKYVIVQMTMTGIDPDGVEPSLASWDLSLATAEGNRYDAEFVVMADDMPSMNDGPTLYPGSAFTGYSAYIVPEAAASFMLYDNANYIAL